jgi:glutamate synthase (NADPH/NADH) small chain
VLRTYSSHEEGGERLFSVGVLGFSGSNGRLERMHAVETERTDEGKTVHKEGTEFEIETDLVLLAIGFTGPVRDRLHEDLKLEYGARGGIVCDNLMRTSDTPGVFVAGDAKRGADLIVTAIAEGRKVAREVDIYLMGDSQLPTPDNSGWS